MPVGEGRIRRSVGRRPEPDVGVDGAEERPEGVREALDVPGRERRGGPPGRAHQRGIANEDLVRPISMADPQLVGLLGVPERGRRGAVDLVLQGVLASGAQLADGDRPAGAVLEPQQNRRHVLSGDVALERLGRALRREGLHRTRRLAAGRDEGRQVCHHRADALPGDEGEEVEPVRADVADRAQRPAAIRLQPPVPVGLEQQPILVVAAGDEPDVSKLSRSDELVDVLVERVEADVEVDGVHLPAARRTLDQVGGLLGGHGQWLLAHHVPIRVEDASHLRVVEVVRRGDVDDLDAIVVEQLIEAAVAPVDAELARALGGSLRAGGDDAVHAHAEPTQGLDMHGPDEPAADDGGPDLARGLHARGHPAAWGSGCRGNCTR